ncbi:MAG: 1,2-phenylacetyl-CoA epoxidase subunit A [Nitriliruptorales bacterium]|nr:1,2-phenylacetyl-CoA epoxidase subunit A [Nitriliruptorales bacterium]
MDTTTRTVDFKRRVDAGEKIEASDWMPEEYRRGAIKFIEMHANSEIMGALPEREWIARAPSLRRKMSLTAKVQDEVGHGHLLYRIAEDLGKPREQMIADLLSGRSKFHNVFHYPTHTWGDVAVIGFLVDGAALVTQKALLDSSYAPYGRVLKRICAEESLHQRHGEDLVLELCAGSDRQRAMFQDAVNRWWVPLIHFFGPPSRQSNSGDLLLHYRFRTATNDELRQRFFSQYVPKLWDLGIDVPDPALAYDDEAGEWRWTEPDWEPLKRIARNQGPMTETRLAWRRWIHESHDWVRQVMAEEEPISA